MTGEYRTEAPPSYDDRPKWHFWLAFKRRRYAGWALYFWHGMGIRAWFNLLRRNHFRTTLTCLPNVVSVSVFAPLNSLLHRISELIYARRAARVRFDPAPIFVLGHWRSGTTFLHDLLACDPEHGFPTTYECFFPSHFMLTEPVGRFVLHLALPDKRPQDDVAVGFDKPQEDEFALCNLGLGSIYMSWALPRGGPTDQRYLDLRDLSAPERREWTHWFMWFLRRVALRQNKRLVLKTPQHTARLSTLIELFPDARFIHLARNPFELLPSTVRLWRSMTSIQGLENPPHDEEWVEESVLATFTRMFECYEEDRALIPEGQLLEIAYEDLVAAPKETLRTIYERLDLGGFGRTEPAVDAYLAKIRDYKPNRHVLPADKRALVLERWGAYIDRFGYRDKAKS